MESKIMEGLLKSLLKSARAESSIPMQKKRIKAENKRGCGGTLSKSFLYCNGLGLFPFCKTISTRFISRRGVPNSAESQSKASKE